MLFSQRKGLKLGQKALQLDCMDDDLRYGLWSAVYEVILRDFKGPSNRWGTERTNYVIGSNLENLIRAYWLSFSGVRSPLLLVHQKLCWPDRRQRHDASERGSR